MARRHDVLGVTGADTVIGTGVKLKGTLHGDGDIAIDGNISGNITATGSVNIGVNATIKSNIEAINVLVNGSLAGNIRAEGEVTLGETAQVVGNITCQNISIATGAVFVGQVHMPQDHGSTIDHDHASGADPGDATALED